MKIREELLYFLEDNTRIVVCTVFYTLFFHKCEKKCTFRLFLKNVYN